ncbi:MAG: hypothetical protein HY608_09935 [Planctomycetes bacterium]|nr:hypothetical protein [Planctomycetota bacterium]
MRPATLAIPAILLVLLAAWLAGRIPAAPADEAPAGTRWTFDEQEPGAPRGFRAEAGTWRVIRDDGAPSAPQVLAQTAANDGGTFNLILAEGVSLRDLDLSVRMRAVGGEIDRGGGLVWRAADARNYYVARYNPLESNYRVYYVRDGRRTQLASADVETDGTAWHVLRVRMEGDHIECFLDGVRHLDVRDGTFAGAGTVGLWTKADAQTRFDNLEASPLPGGER